MLAYNRDYERRSKAKRVKWNKTKHARKAVNMKHRAVLASTLKGYIDLVQIGGALYVLMPSNRVVITHITWLENSSDRAESANLL